MKTFAHLCLLALCLSLMACRNNQPGQRLAKASRENKNGWIYVHLEGSPADIGYQHGYLLSDDIDTSIQAVSYLLAHDTQKDWSFYRSCARDFLWPHLDREYKDEINGIVEGLQAQHKNYDSLDITALNAVEELAFYYVPSLMEQAKAGNGNNKAPGNCSAFIATGSYTKDDKIVTGLPYFEHMHRYLPALVKRAGFQSRSVPVGHRPRTAGVSKYGMLDRLWVGLADLRGVAWLMRRGKVTKVEEL